MYDVLRSHIYDFCYIILLMMMEKDVVYNYNKCKTISLVLHVDLLLVQLTAEKCGGNYELLEKIIDCLLGRLNDRSVHVRRLAVRGLSNFAHLQNDQVNVLLIISLCSSI